MLRIFLLLILAVTASPAGANGVSGMRVVGDAERTRFVIDLEKNPDFAVSRLAGPYRLVIDMPDVEFKEAAEPGEGRGLIKAFRYGLIAPGKGRVVLDLSGPVDITNTFVLDPVAPEPARLVVDVVPTTAAAFEAALQSDKVPVRTASVPAVKHGEMGFGARPRVVIDPGHGGIDSGAVGAGGLLEKDVTLKFGIELARQLEMGGKLQPILTRHGDDFRSLAERVEVARQHRAAFFVSLHADSVAQDYVRGATVYTLSDDASDALAAAMAERENRSDILAGLALEDQPDDVANILFDLARRETKNLSIRFAKSLVGGLKGAMPLNGNPWRRASFRVLKAPDVPSVLLELGYLSNKEDEALFRDKDWPVPQADKVARAVEEFLSASVVAGQ